MNGRITTHVLDQAHGRPARSLAVVLDRHGEHEWIEIGRGMTDDDGRLRDLVPPGTLQAGSYRLRFETGVWFAGHAMETFYDEVVIQFHVADASQHYHVPLLLSPFGYSTYRGS